MDVPNPIVFQFLGKISYGLYVTSVPLITLLSRVLHALLIGETFLWPWFGYMVIAVLIGFAALLDTHFDVPARVYLREWLIPSKTTVRE
jgi:peptidoglycan/LPS O-acetylase OafA/YrhL